MIDNVTHFRNDFDELDVFSSTDLKCAWGNSRKRKLKPFKATPIKNIKCYEKSYRSINAYTTTEAQQEELEKRINSFNAGRNALNKHM